MINGRTHLHVVANGTMTGQRYIEVLLPHVRFFRGAVGDKFVFMDDNATCHRTLAVQDCLDSEGIQRLVWPARSPDLNPIENVWDALGRQVAGRNYPPTNKNTLIRALTEEWDKLPQQLLDNVVQISVLLYFDAPAREDCVLLGCMCHNGQPGLYAVRSGISMETRGESETYKKKRNRQGLYDKYRD
ncbi:transposable element Tcb1 transposase [Trichonephila clavipes]|nr:transposable element Tcb1 transposase [Trichonephila clavipes]